MVLGTVELVLLVGLLLVEDNEGGNCGDEKDIRKYVLAQIVLFSLCGA